MSGTPCTPLPAKEQIALRRERRGPVAPEAIQRNKELVRAQRAVLAAIASEPKTVPDIAEETGIDAQLVFWLMAGLRKYNQAESVKKKGDYMTYRKKEGGD